MINKRGQIWIETAIYTLIGLTIIAIVLSIATPQIEKSRERAIIQQTKTALDDLNVEIQKVQQNAGTVKIVYFKLTKGKLDINSNEDKITYTMEDTKLEFSEEGVEIKEGEVTFKTEKNGKRFNVIMELYYDNINITHNGNDELRTLQASGSAHKLQLENVGDNEIGGKTHVDLKVG